MKLYMIEVPLINDYLSAQKIMEVFELKRGSDGHLRSTHVHIHTDGEWTSLLHESEYFDPRVTKTFTFRDDIYTKRYNGGHKYLFFINFEHAKISKIIITHNLLKEFDAELEELQKKRNATSEIISDIYEKTKLENPECFI